MKHTRLNQTLRQHLLDIYHLSEKAGHSTDYISIAALNEFYFTSITSLNRAVLRLKELGLVDHQPYQGVRLTQDGLRTALPWVRRQRIAEMFLSQVMGFEWHEVEAEARRMIGGMNEQLTERMFHLAGKPVTCPHGEPIPTADGTVAAPHDQPLFAAPLKTDLVLTRVLTREPERLKYIGALRLFPGTIVQVIHVAPFNGPIQLKLERDYRIIGHNLAETIYVRSADHSG